MLDADPADSETPGGLKWTIVGAVSNSNSLSFAGGPLGSKITTPPAPGLFLANVNVPQGLGTYKVQIINAGVLVQELTPLLAQDYFEILPEPTAAALAGLALVGAATARRSRGNGVRRLASRIAWT